MTSGYYLGVDIGGTKMAVSVFDIATSVVTERREFPTSVACEPVEAIQHVVTIAQMWILQRGLPPKSVGVSVGGMFDHVSGCMIHAPHLPLWDGFPIVQTLHDLLHVPVYAENDANACALAEWRYGAGQGCQHLIFLTFGTGLGGGLILNGQLYRGACGLAGEVGAIRIAPQGPPLRNKPGCLEGFASGAGIAMQAAAARLQHKDSLLPMQPSAKDVAQSARNGDVLAISLMQESGYQLGCGLAILIDLFNPEMIVLGSIFTRCEDLLRPTMEQAIQQEAMPRAVASCQIVAADLGDSIGDYAAAAVAELYSK